ncbi:MULTISPECIES: indolepyruvate ferredoxin oxidoreductase family protein [Cupriavidus]|uniref:Indolepyruvate ferredoxin oxidoreductase family protein n=2 Tax=Pseudomonadota TaxID=1224 RepID=A0A643G2B6_9BURK|nr:MULTISPECIES: indolepyruvate ferredoxin oxidoreductase family protein [Cupriavidus]KUE87952.1 indolepyruvate ferredoxin oxidoreductase [Cupriavidus necator]NOV23720.1 indolepyruvate ferredoxin oxidoreductase family protein [Cupriavidus necator]QOT81775.1 indolepyruvate ferredoxin oxidoreductase family protein [Cupriavidus basilensis]BDB30373.1 indolepyruvate ferredoxin oxidoreductase family protein [Cupriavidus sp. P-10]
MNSPLPEAIRKSLEKVTLDDKYSLDRGRAFMSGVQALVRLPMLQRQRDLAAGLNTSGFISGYRGSPLGGYDQALWAAKKHLQANHVVFQPGLNEELAATALWGSQQLDLYPQTKKYDGVFGLWYGKGPGVDRCSDVFKHANMAGTAKHGGVIAIAGDDHASKSSTAAHQSDHIFKACGMPVFFPSSVQEILDLGLHAFAMSRFSGVWMGMKTIQEVVESTTSVSVDPDRVQIALPEDFAMPPGGVHIRWPDPPLEQEARLMDYKWYAALAYMRANRLNRNVIEGPQDRFGIIASGKAYNDTRQALVDLGLDDDTCRRLGIRLHKVNVVWPLEATATREFAMGLQEVLVVEEKRQVIEYQIKEALYNWRPDVRPNVLGKFDEQEGDHTGGEWSMPNPSENWLLRAKADLTPAIIAKAIAKRLRKIGMAPEGSDIAARMDARLAVIDQRERAMAEMKIDTGDRMPWFCSGCPHNTSTRVPEGSRALAGIGCHYMSQWMDRSTSTFSQMGGEGVAWVGQAPFTTDKHVFANVGDGTYFHSGLLAIRQSIAAGVNITYKVLYNDAVAMTGGQQVGERPEGHSVLQIQKSLVAEGVKKLVIVTDEPQKYDGVTLEAGVTVHHRDDLDKIQRELREIAGCTAIIYDQTCATEKRRRRKRGKLATPAKTVVINELVCEGCGDCSVQSNCLSVEPLETEFGRKRRINQNSCNKDYSCVKGFCPSFVTIEGGELKKPKKEKKGDLAALPRIPEPVLPVAEEAWGILVAGVGGTGVITIGQVLGMAAHLEGKGIVTQDAAGLAQKGGSTWSHVQIANRPEAIHTTKIDTANADLLIACDAIVGANKYATGLIREGRTFVALNTHGTPTAAFTQNPDWQFPGGNCEAVLAAAAGAQMVSSFDAEQAAVQLLGDSIYTNPLMLGYAWQMGKVPLSHAALMRAMELNGVQIENNKAAFEWGRRCAHDLKAVQALYQAAAVIEIVRKPSLDQVIRKRVEFLTAYQNAAYAADYQSFVEKVRSSETRLKSTRLTEAVARYLFKLMAYKDEYEVARLHTDAAFTQKLADMFEGDFKVVHHLAPPTFAKRNDKGELVKQPFGPWMRRAFGILAKMKSLRGTALDPFGRTEERRTERALIQDYRASVEELLPMLSPEKLSLAVEIARIPEEIRGYGHVKERHLAAAREKWAALRHQWRNGTVAKEVA